MATCCPVINCCNVSSRKTQLISEERKTSSRQPDGGVWRKVRFLLPVAVPVVAVGASPTLPSPTGIEWKLVSHHRTRRWKRGCKESVV